MIKNLSPKELFDILQSDPDSVELIDVREQVEYDEIHIKNAKLIPMKEIMGRLSEIDWSKKAVLYCRTGSRSAYVATIMGTGKRLLNLAGGIVDFAQIDPENRWLESRIQ